MSTKEAKQDEAEPAVVVVEPEEEPLEPHVHEHRLLDVEYDGEPVGPYDELAGPLGDPVGKAMEIPDPVLEPLEPKESKSESKSAKK